jgi:signal transduction histidine kinase
MLLVTFLGMAGYEAIEMWVLETPRLSSAPLAILLHSLQVVIILVVVWIVVQAWRQKDIHAATLARMVEQVTFAQENERRRIAYELHDGISPLIVSAQQHLDTCVDLWAREPERAKAQLETGADRLRLAIVEVRRMLSALRPSVVASRGLSEAARQSLEEAATEAGWGVTFHEDLGDTRLPAVVETAAFRILQEAIANIRKHARADCVEVELCRNEGWLNLDVRDDGVGFLVDAAREGRSLGLVSMQERAQLVGGTCTIESAQDRGTRIRARLPLRPDD